MGNACNYNAMPFLAQSESCVRKYSRESHSFGLPSRESCSWALGSSLCRVSLCPLPLPFSNNIFPPWVSLKTRDCALSEDLKRPSDHYLIPQELCSGLCVAILPNSEPHPISVSHIRIAPGHAIFSFSVFANILRRLCELLNVSMSTYTSNFEVNFQDCIPKRTWFPSREFLSCFLAHTYLMLPHPHFEQVWFSVLSSSMEVSVSHENLTPTFWSRVSNILYLWFNLSVKFLLFDLMFIGMLTVQIFLLPR